MTLHELLLKSGDGQNFEARLFYNRESLNRNGLTPHAHPALEISVLGDCRGKYNIGGILCAFEPNDIFLFRSNEPHCISELEASSEPVCLGIHFYPSMFWSLENNESAAGL